MLEALSGKALEVDAAALDRCVDATPGTDPFCSASDWVLACARAWVREPLLFRGAAGYLAFRREGCALFGLDPMWDYACPVAAPAPLELLASLDLAPWRVVEFPGLVEGGETFRAVVAALGGRRRLFVGAPRPRIRASLEGGVGGYLARRPRKLRRSVRDALRRAARERVEVVEGDGDLDRLVAVEARSWKGEAGEGLLHPDLQAFYRELFGRLRARGAFRVLVARRDGEDLAYIAGGVRGAVYRGLQFSYDARHRRLGLGNLLQHAQIEALAREGIETYDLGMELPYKRRWGEERFVTVTVAAR